MDIKTKLCGVAVIILLAGCADLYVGDTSLAADPNYEPSWTSSSKVKPGDVEKAAAQNELQRKLVRTMCDDGVLALNVANTRTRDNISNLGISVRGCLPDWPTESFNAAYVGTTKTLDNYLVDIIRVSFDGKTRYMFDFNPPLIHIESWLRSEALWGRYYKRNLIEFQKMIPIT